MRLRAKVKFEEWHVHWQVGPRVQEREKPSEKHGAKETGGSSGPMQGWVLSEGLLRHVRVPLGWESTVSTQG